MIKMEPLLIGILMTLTVCASHPLETTKSPLDIANNAILSGSKNHPSVPLVPVKTHPEEIRLNITLNIDENEKEIVDVDMVPSQPRNVTVHEVTSSSIKISWLEPEKPNGPNLIYRIYYTYLNQTLLAMPKNDPDNAKSESGIHYYTLRRLRPYTEYKIVVVAITPRHDGNGSTPIFQRTDVAAPAAPILSNLACQKDGTIYVKWKRPMIYYNTIDFYIISFKASVWDFYRQFQINSSAEHIEIELKIPNLTLNEIYEVKLQAASLSIFNPNKLQISEATSPRQIALHPNCEHIEASQRTGFVHNYDFTIIATVVLSCFGFIFVVMVFVLWRRKQGKKAPSSEKS